MNRLCSTELARKPMDVLDMTSLTPDECQLLVPAFEKAFQEEVEYPQFLPFKIKAKFV